MAYDAFLVFGEIVEGESQDKEFGPKKAIDVYSFSWGASNPTSVGQGGGLSAGKASFSSLNIMKRADNATSDLLMAVATGKQFNTATLTLRKAISAKQTAFLVITLTDVMIESVQHSGSGGGDDYPTESVSIAYGKIDMAYTPQKPDGTPGTTKNFTYNVVQNSKED